MNFLALRGFAALAAVAAGDSRASVFRLVEGCAARLEREHVPDATACAALLRGQARAARGDREGAVRGYRRALAHLGTRETLLGRAVGERLGEIVGGDEGAARLGDNRAWAEGQGVVRPDRLFAIYAPVR
jgi:hypothetical protein